MPVQFQRLSPPKIKLQLNGLGEFAGFTQSFRSSSSVRSKRNLIYRIERSIGFAVQAIVVQPMISPNCDRRERFVLEVQGGSLGVLIIQVDFNFLSCKCVQSAWTLVVRRAHTQSLPTLSGYLAGIRLNAGGTLASFDAANFTKTFRLHLIHQSLQFHRSREIRLAPAPSVPAINIAHLAKDAEAYNRRKIYHR